MPSSQDQQKTIGRRLITSKVSLTGQSHFMRGVWTSVTVSVLSILGQMPKESLLVKYNLPQFKRIVDAVKERLNAKALIR